MEQPLQAKLLRFLQDGVVERVGGGRALKADVRVIAATNKNLEEMMEHGKFREDLYYRLNAVELVLPPLRGRASDIRDFVYHFISRANAECERNITGISNDALNRLVAFNWPGNVRQLENVIARAVLVADGDIIQPEDLPSELRLVEPAGGVPSSGPVRTARNVARDAISAEVEKKLVVDCLEKSHWSVAAAARLAGYSRVHMHRLMDKHGIKRPKRPGDETGNTPGRA